MGADEIVSLGRGLLIQGDVDAALHRRKFHSVGQQVQNHLVQTHTVTADVLRQNVVDEDVKLLLLGPHLGLDNVDDAVHHLPQGDLVDVQRHLPALDFGHIQHVVDQVQQVLAGQGDFFQTVLDLLGIFDIGCGDGRHAHNGVHGRSDVVTHVGEEFTFGLVGGDSCLTGLLQLGHLLFGDLDVPEEDQQQRRQHYGAPDNGHTAPLVAEMGDLLVQRAVGHHHHQIPLRVGQLGAKQVAVLLTDDQHGGVVLPRVHGGLKLLDMPAGVAAAQLVVNGVDPVKVAVPEGLAAADDEGAVLPDDVGVHHAVLVVKGEGVADVVHRQGRHPGGARFSAGHGIGGGDPHQDQAGSVCVGAHGDLLAAGVQGGQEGLRVDYGQLAAVEGFKGAVCGVKGQVFKAAGSGAVHQVLHQVVPAFGAGEIGLHQGFHLAQPQVHGGLKVHGDLLAHAGHIDFAHVADGILAPPAHVKRQEGKDADAEEREGDQAHHQKAKRRFVVVHRLVPPCPRAAAPGITHQGTPGKPEWRRWFPGNPCPPAPQGRRPPEYSRDAGPR